MHITDWPIYSWGGLNQTIFLWINSFHAHWWDAVMLAATDMGSASKFPYWIALALLIALRRPALMPQLNVAVFATGFMVTGVLVPWVKSAIDLPRPLVVLGRDVVTVVGREELIHSFPSGHAAFVSLMCIALGTNTPRPMKWTLLIFFAFVALSRIVVGAHFPADVVGGAIIGFGTGFLVRLLLSTAQR